MLKLFVITLLLGAGVACRTETPARSPEESLFQKRCGNCHALPLPSAYSAKEWQRIVPQMSGNARLSKAEEAQLLAWLLAQRSGKAP